MPLLIDGYNLLHMLGWIDRRRGAKALEEARWRLVRFLASVLSPAERAETTVVFDAAQPPPLAARCVQAEGITVRFAVGYRSADELLEELIEQALAPRSYVVVSSDRRVRRAALRRQMQALDCWTWYERMITKRVPPHRPSRSSVADGETRPLWTHLPLTEAEVDRWVRTFSEQNQAEPGKPEQNIPSHLPELFESPFPPGYAEDVEEE
ncbi:MAG: NYN domain-containing protein [Thermoguttaceae bacterium]|nr:NYN domain-containing protein [Thermoguttaceae bacterium]MDW8037153.1 NYN domain-containing protein [Thermoguttaceae bacterium]